MAKKNKKPDIMHQQGLFPFELILARDEDNVRQVSIGNIEDLATSIRTKGLLHPIGISVIENPTSDDLTEEDLEIMGLEEMPDRVGILRYGFRRFYAIAEIRSEDSSFFEDGVPVTQLGKDADDFTGAVQNITENLDREQITPGELAERLSLLAEGGKSATEIAERINRSVTYVSGLLRLKKNLIDEAFEAFFEGALTYDVARVVSDQGRAAAKEVKEAGGDKDEQQAANAKAQRSALKRAQAALEKVTEGSTKKLGVKAAAQGDGPTKPSKKVLTEKVEELSALKGESRTPEVKAVLAALEWVLGTRASCPAVGPKKARASKEEQPPAKAKKSKKAPADDDEEEPAPKKKRGRPAKAA